MLLLSILLSQIFAREVDFAWEAFQNARAYQIQVASDIEFTDIILKKLTKKPKLSIELPYGQMYYRVRAINQKKKPGIWSEPGLVLVKPYSPETISPPTDSSYVLFKKALDIPFEWKEQKDHEKYVILIKKESGEKVIEQEIEKSKWTWSATQEGNYTWQVRSIFQGDHYSDYSSPKSFSIKQRQMGSPILISPNNNEVLPAYRKTQFSWEYFPPSKYSLIEIKGPTKKKYLFDEKDSVKIESLDPGEYQWRVGSSEEKKSAKAYSEWRNFTASEEMISNKDHVVGMKLHYKMWDATYKPKRNSADSTVIKTDDAYSLYEWYANWQMSAVSSFYFSFQSSKVDAAKEYSYSDTTLAYKARFGTADYQQSLLLGIKQGRYLELWNVSNSLNSNVITGRSLLFGLQMLGRMSNGLRLHIDLTYATPTSTFHSDGKLKGDQFMSQIGVSKKVYQKLWAHYYIGYERNILKFETDTEGSTSWKSESFVPLRFALEYRH